MPELIKALEKFLGVESSGPFSPREEHAQTLDEAVAAFRAVPAARLRPKLILAFLAATLCVALISLTFSWTWAGGFFGLVLLTSVAYFVLAGASQKSYLFTKVRELIFGSGWKDWLTWIVAGLLLFVVLYLFGWLWMWIAGCVLAVVLAAGFHYTIDARIASRRSEPLEKVQRMLRSMRLKGLEEDSLRQFVCKYAGDYWEEFYEALFGYEAKLAARDRWPHGDRGAARAKYGALARPSRTLDRSTAGGTARGQGAPALASRRRKGPQGGGRRPGPGTQAGGGGGIEDAHASQDEALRACPHARGSANQGTA